MSIELKDKKMLSVKDFKSKLAQQPAGRSTLDVYQELTMKGNFDRSYSKLLGDFINDTGYRLNESNGRPNPPGYTPKGFNTSFTLPSTAEYRSMRAQYKQAIQIFRKVGNGSMATAMRQSSPMPVVKPLSPAELDAARGSYQPGKADEVMEEDFMDPLRFPKILKAFKTLLLYGPPGTGKTMFARNVVNLMGGRSVIIEASGAQLKGKYLGETEKLTAHYYSEAQRFAEENKDPTVMFIDEFDAIASDRNKSQDKISTLTTTAVLQALDGIKGYPDVITIAATNFPSNLDPAILRRFPIQLFIDLPGDARVAKLITTTICKDHLTACNPADLPAALVTELIATTRWAGDTLEDLTKRLGAEFKEDIRRYFEGGRDEVQMIGEKNTGYYGWSMSDVKNMVHKAMNYLLRVFLRRTKATEWSDGKRHEDETVLLSDFTKWMNTNTNELQGLRYQIQQHVSPSVSRDDYARYLEYHLTTKRQAAPVSNTPTWGKNGPFATSPDNDVFYSPRENPVALQDESFDHFEAFTNT